jgi:hypothetical protein
MADMTGMPAEPERNRDDGAGLRPWQVRAGRAAAVMPVPLPEP